MKLGKNISIERRPAHGAHTVFDVVAHVLLATVDADGRIKFLNRAWETMMGFAPDELRSRPLREILPLEREAADAVVAILLDRACHAPVETSVRSRSGVMKRILWHKRFEPNDSAMYLAGEEIDSRAENGAGGSEGNAAA
jgi:PAS domain S-box-containing protein